ncbi:MAG: glutathione-disulfide reductase [Beijerinckiaceae bacterium]|nr:glutathione-disulfide reductase [Beijerinckiaceae bacterium]
MSDFDVDLFVIGAGSGGVRSARIAAGYGARVMIAEEFRIGGICVIRGCVPKKLYVYASRFVDEFEDAAGFGWTIPQAPQFDWRKLVDAKEKEITRLSGLYRKGLDGAKVQIVESRAVVEGPHEVRIVNDGRIVRAKYILVATGGAPTREPEAPGVEHAITSDEIFDLPHFPKRLFVVGGGYIALEFASVFARLGAQVDVSMRADNILRGFDDDVRTALRDALAHAGVRFHFGTLPTSYEKTGEGLRVTLANGESLTVDQALVATGRRPHTSGLGLEKAGVELRANGAVKVDNLSRTSAPSVFAVGDVTDLNNLTPVAIREGHTLADRLFGGKDVACDHEIIPTAVFTTPEVGVVGFTEQAARERFDVVDIYKASFRPMRATLSGREEKVLMKVVVDGVTDKVLGVHIIGHDAGEMIQLVGIAMKMGATKADFDATMAVHPTAAEELVTMRTRTARYER